MANKFLIVCGGSGYKLLGQRRILEVSAELHVDVSSEIAAAPGDECSLAVKLDPPVGTVANLLLDVGRSLEESKMPDRSDYVQTAITDEADKEHARLLIEDWPSSGPLRDGLAQSPAIGGATVRVAGNVHALNAALRKMVTDFATNVGPQNPLDIWIISSTAGGTGEGVHRFVAASLAEIVRSTYITSLKLNFVRIGPLTYRSVNEQKTMLNSFFGIAADAAFELKFKEDFPGASINWFFVDVPDVGTGTSGKERRAEIIEMVTKSIMLNNLAEDMAKLLANNAGIRMVIVRAGYWGKDFSDRLKYCETLRELSEKLREVIEPDSTVKSELKPEFQWPETLEVAVKKVEDAKYLEDKIRGGWQFPKLARGTMSDDRFREITADWKRAIDPLIAPSQIGGLGVQYTTIETVTVKGEQRTEERPLRVPAVGSGRNYDEPWVRGINDAHRVKAWCTELLGESAGSGGLRAKLLGLAQTCSDAQHSLSGRFGSTRDKARNLAGSLGDFVTTLEQVDHLVELQERVTLLLGARLAHPRDILKLVTKELDIVKSGLEDVAASPIKAAELYEPLDRLTGESWLRLIDRAAQRRRKDILKEEVLRGATGLTHAGLVSVLGIEEGTHADAARIMEELKDKWGQMFDREGNSWEAQWWGAMDPQSVTANYSYRILPHLEDALEEELRAGSEKDAEMRYIFAKLGLIGLYVLAFEGASLNSAPGPDTTSAPAYLLRPLLAVVDKALGAWKDELRRGEREPSGQFEIATAGVIGEPLYKKALLAAGLTEEKLEKIGQYYKFY